MGVVIAADVHVRATRIIVILYVFIIAIFYVFDVAKLDESRRKSKSFGQKVTSVSCSVLCESHCLRTQILAIEKCAKNAICCCKIELKSTENEKKNTDA